ncbi:MAG: trypsin-like peptidase domain-containing protein, partial [Ruminococcus sp.]|nr:trypsin-like peptidase domain-containing protein [Ruminococcus sp.]
MNEYNYNTPEMNTAPTGFATDGGSPKKPKKHTALKITALAMSMALVSAGSIGIYSEIAGMRARNASAVTEEAAETSDKTALLLENVGLITNEEKSGKALETEDIVEKLLPSVVGIESKFKMTSSVNNGGFYFGFGGSSRQPSDYTATATGTGVVITEDGYIVTNAHVIYDSENGGGEAESVSVILDNDESYDAEIIGYDTDCDIAVLKIDEDGLTAAEFGDSDSLRLGESVIAIGNPLGFELKDTVTGGMISGLNRDITINDKAMTLIQTDAAINSGNSGGPLINKYGQVIGINSSKMSSSYGSGASIEGIGFAIPSNAVSSIVDDIMEYGYVTGKPQLGISAQDVTETISQMYDLPVGVYVTAVSEGSAADKSGLQKGDIITAVNGKTVETTEELNAQKNKYSAGDTVEL